MRLFLLPISTRRTLIYCERVQETLKNGASQPLSERIINRATTTWATWEKADSGWQKKLTVYGNQLFKRIPYEEWGLKSLPPATKKRLEEVDADQGRHRLECLYPGAFMRGRSVSEVLRTLATERQRYHNRSMWTCIAWMPVTAPFTLVPVIPNIPFFYLCFRVYSHYRALYGGRFLEHVLKKDLVKTTDSKIMDELYAQGLLHPHREATREAGSLEPAALEQVVQKIEQQANDGKDEVMLLQRWNGKLIAEEFKLPEMEIEIERAVEQVEKAIKVKVELAQGAGQKATDVVEKEKR